MKAPVGFEFSFVGFELALADSQSHILNQCAHNIFKAYARLRALNEMLDVIEILIQNGEVESSF